MNISNQSTSVTKTRSVRKNSVGQDTSTCRFRRKTQRQNGAKSPKWLPCSTSRVLTNQLCGYSRGAEGGSGGLTEAVHATANHDLVPANQQ